jgi:integrase
VTLGAFVPPAERRQVSARLDLSLHTAIAEFIANMVNNRESKNYTDTVAYLLFNFLEFFDQVDLRDGRHIAPEDLPRCRLRVAKYKRTPSDDVPRLLEPLPSDRSARLITSPIVEAYKCHRLNVADADETTVNNELKILRMFGKWLQRRVLMDDNPFAFVKDVKDDGPGVGRALDVDEFGGLAHASEQDLRLWLLVTGLHGLRKSETNTLRPEDINVEEGFIDIRKHFAPDGTLLWRPKFGKERKVPMVEAALPLMSRLRAMPTDKHGHVMGVHDRRKALDRAMVLAQIRGHVRFHDLRHTAYTRLKDEALRNLDPKLALGDIKLIFGHSDVTMDAVYDHRTMDRLRAFISMTPLVQPVVDLLAA